jgi:hypothetical protein
MKKLFIILIALMSFAVYVNAADAVAVGDSITNARYTASNIRWVWMTTDDSLVASSDSFAAEENKKIYGVYELASRPRHGSSRTGPQAKGFHIYACPTVAAGDTIVGSYMLLPYVNGSVPTFTDTVGTWTAACTTVTATGVNKYIDLSSSAGSFLVWRWWLISASAGALRGNSGLGFKDDATYFRTLD